MHLLKTAILLLVSAFAGTHAVSAQITTEQLKRSLIDRIGFTAEDIAALESGDVVVKALPSKEKREVGVFGIVRIRELPPVSADLFRESLAQDTSGSVTKEGQFSVPPTDADLAAMELDGEDLEDLPKCRRGDCLINLSAETLGKFEREIDWASPDHAARATDLMRQVIAGYVRSYSAGGNKTLGTFDDRKVPVELAKEHERLLANSVLVADWAPELIEHLRNYPESAPPGTDSRFLWSAVDFGLDPIIAVTHLATYMRNDAGMQQHFMATKQIYATRYVDASLAFTVLLRVPDDSGNGAYLVFTNRSTSEDMGGIFGGLKRAVVEKEATAKAADLLDRAHLRLKAATMPRSEPTPDSGVASVIGEYAGKPWVIASVIFLLGLGVLFGYQKIRNGSVN